MTEINVLYQFNEKYVPFAGVSMTSLLINNKDVGNVNIYALSEDISSSSRELLEQAVSKYGGNIFFPDCSRLIEQFKMMGMIPYRGAYSVYLRLFFAELLEISGKRAIYLDSDTIIEGSLLPLMEYDLGGKSVGMVLESIRDNYKIMIGMGTDSDYYNSGVILFDVEKWRENKYSERIVDHIKNVRCSYIGDQDFLNIVCEGDICRLPLIYNFQPLHGHYTAREYFETYKLRKWHRVPSPLEGDMVTEEYYSPKEVDDAKYSAVVYHCYRWLGEFPWNKGNLHPFNDVFDRVLRISLWRDYTKSYADIGIMIRIEKVLYRVLPKRIFIKIFKWAHQMMLKNAERNARIQKTNSRA